MNQVDQKVAAIEDEQEREAVAGVVHDARSELRGVRALAVRAEAARSQAGRLTEGEIRDALLEEIDETERAAAIDVRKTADLFRHYDRQTERQPCFVELDPETAPPTLRADFSGEIGNAIPKREFHRRLLRWAIPCLTAAAADELLEELRPLAARVAAGYERTWNGSNHVGRLNDDAAEAADEIERRCSEADGPGIAEWDAGDWLDGISGGLEGQAAEFGVTADTTDDQLDAIAKKVEGDAGTDDEGNEIRITGLDDHLRELRRLRREADPRPVCEVCAGNIPSIWTPATTYCVRVSRGSEAYYNIELVDVCTTCEANAFPPEQHSVREWLAAAGDDEEERAHRLDALERAGVDTKGQPWPLVE